MHTRCKNIYFHALLLWLCASPLSVYGVSFEPNALDHTPSSFEIPKVNLKPLSHQYSLFTSYLKDFDKESLINLKDLSWDIFIPRRSEMQNTPLTKDNFLNNAGTSVPLKTKGKILYTQDIEKTLAIFFEDNFSQNIVRKSNKEEMDNNHLGAPLKAAKNIQAFLEASNEFKKSSCKETKPFTLALAKKIAQKQVDQVSAEQKTLLKPISTMHEFLICIENKEVLEQEGFLGRILTPTTEQQETLFPLSIPEVNAFFQQDHPYSPYLKINTAFLTFPIEHISHKNPMKKVLTSIHSNDNMSISLDDHYNDKDTARGFTAKLANREYRTLLPTRSPLLKKDNTCAYLLSSLRIKQEKEKKLQSLHQPIDKYAFIENTLDILLPWAPFTISALEDGFSLIEAIHKTVSAQDSTIRAAPTPFTSTFLKNVVTAHSFRGHIKNTPLIDFLSDAILTPTPDNTSLSLKSLENITNGMDDVYAQVEIQQTFKNRALPVHTAENETNIAKNYISLDLARKQTSKTSKAQVTNYKLSDDKNINYTEINFSKLAKAKPDQPDLFLISTLPYFLKKLHKSISTNGYSSNATGNTTGFLALTENSPTQYGQITDKKVDTEISFASYKIPRPFSIPIEEKGYDKEITKHAAVISEEKEMQPVTSCIRLPAENIFIAAAPLPVSTDIHANRNPIPLNKVYLEKHINVTKANFQQNISLPETAKGREKASFDMHPLLSLFNSDIFDIGKEAQNNATIINRSTRMTGYSLFNWPTLEQLDTDSFPEGFTIQTRLLSSSEDKEIDFACTIRADEKDLIGRLPIHILYILDTSKSIEAHRFNLFKKAILQSLEHLDRRTTFNIAVLDNGKIQKLREKGVAPTKSARSYAKRFLRKIDQSGKISFSHLVTLLEKEKHLALKSGASRSCVLLTDGNFAGSLRVESSLLKRLTAINAGNFSIYTASISDKNNKSMLSLLSKLNHGFSLFTRTHASFPRKFSLMLKHIKEPVMHDIVVSFPDDDDDETKAYVNDTISPILLTGRNLTIFGTSPTKKSRRVFIQGRSGNKWINILKELPLDNSRTGRHSLQKKLANQKTLFSLQSFLDTNDEKYLSDAKKYSEEYDLHTLVP
jgi:hypothetical protein